jgi:hypothetical protein
VHPSSPSPTSLRFFEFIIFVAAPAHHPHSVLGEWAIESGTCDGICESQTRIMDWLKSSQNESYNHHAPHQYNNYTWPSFGLGLKKPGVQNPSLGMVISLKFRPKPSHHRKNSLVLGPRARHLLYFAHMWDLGPARPDVMPKNQAHAHLACMVGLAQAQDFRDGSGCPCPGIVTTSISNSTTWSAQPVI